MDDDFVRATDVIAWGSPILSFGDPIVSRVATLGLNPSDLEFLDDGRERNGVDRRFETLASLGLSSWTQAGRPQRDRMLATYRDYFKRNPYWKWFDPLDTLIAGTGCSYRGDTNPACHLDLVPFATSAKWGSLDTRRKRALLEVGGDLLGAIVRDSAIEVVVLNGSGVCKLFDSASYPRLEPVPTDALNQIQSNGKIVRGVAYVGRVTKIANVDLGRPVRVMGYNTNLQSGFGVTNALRSSIATWISEEARRGEMSGFV